MTTHTETKTVTNVTFKHEGHDEHTGLAVGPVLVGHEGGEYVRYADSEFNKIDGRPMAAWCDLKTARLIASDHGLELEEG